ncbi:YbaK/EbsC family protein [Planomonospora sp. ID67723]|uniref:aminoacyl-tRNA deacylase n=1 Tax=Planomonospora sp. ID67723 TaxID=2738134 RepID=UPI0018C3C87E|nr:YbaK/EbsC family protein [Planomonospora sp. ID67723]MBG0826954.1 YbaK/EbsC family protein [Planomonospora sp. ID67723]
MKDALAIHRWLLAHQIHHEIVRLPRALTCVDDLPEVLSVDPATCVGVTVFEVTTRVGREPVAIVAPVGTPPRPGVVGAALGARRVRPASAFTVNSATDYAAGLVCPLLLPENLTVLVDDRLTRASGPVHTPTGERHTALLIRADDLLELVSGKTADLSAPRHRNEPVTVPLAG